MVRRNVGKVGSRASDASAAIELRGSGIFRIAVIATSVVVITETQWSYEFSRISLAFFTVAIASALVLPSLPRRIYLISPIALALTALAVVSSSWSADADRALENSLYVVAALYSATLIASTARTNEIAWGIALGQLVILAASLALLALDPAAVLVTGEYENGSFRGVFGHRNLFAFFMLIGLAASLAIPGRGVIGVVFRIVVSGSFFTAIVASASRTTIVLAAAVIAASILVSVLRVIPLPRRLPISAAIAGIGVVLIVVFVANVERAVGLLGRDGTLSGRTVIWERSFELIARQPVLGYGWDSVWGSAAPGSEINAGSTYPVNHAHSIYVEMWLTLGLVGLALLVLGLLVALAYSTAGALFGDGSSLLWLNLALVLAIHGLTETMLVRPAGLLLFLLLLARAVNDGGRPSPVTRILCLAICVRGGRPQEIWRH